MNDTAFMELALAEAAAAATAGEVPVGAVAVLNGEVAACARNRVEELHRVDGHAEFELMRRICDLTGDWRLEEFDIYVTKEPCLMCAGMLINARARRIVYGVGDSVFGGCGGAVNPAELPKVLWRPEIVGGVCAEAALRQIQEFFRSVRQKKVKTP